MTDVYGNKQRIRDLLDYASQVNFITSNCMNRLGLKYSPIATPIYGIGNISNAPPRGTLTCKIASCYATENEFDC